MQRIVSVERKNTNHTFIMAKNLKIIFQIYVSPKNSSLADIIVTVFPPLQLRAPNYKSILRHSKPEITFTTKIIRSYKYRLMIHSS